jgi:adenylate/nucleoside-diphosphate kinase
LEEAADFDKKANEIEVIKNIFNGINEIFINANFFDVEEEKVSTSIVELLGEARKLPELVFMLTSDEQKWLDRVLDKRAIEQELEDLKEKKRIEKEKERE